MAVLKNEAEADNVAADKEEDKITSHHLVSVVLAVEELHAQAHAAPTRTPKIETKMVLVAKPAQIVVDQAEINQVETESIETDLAEAIQTETIQTQAKMDTQAASPHPKANALPSVVDVAIVLLAHRIQAAQLRELAAQRVPQDLKQNPAQRSQNENDARPAKAKTNGSAQSSKAS